MTTLLTDEAALAELGHRLARQRLDRDMTQEALAAEAGVSRSTVRRLEAGESTQMTAWLRVLRALGLLDNLDALLPAAEARPLEALRGKPRQRASSRTTSPDAKSDTASHAKSDAPRTWRWGDEGPADKGSDS